MKRGMLRVSDQIRWCDGLPAAAALALALVLPACSGSGGFGGPSTTVSSASPASPPSSPAPPAPAQSSQSGTPSLKDKIETFFSSATQKEPQPVTNAQPSVDCPYIDIRQGAATLTIPPPPPDGGNEAMSLKYQGIFVRAARDCTVTNGQMVMRVGIQGRLIVGPAGGPGQVEVPLRIAVLSAPTAGSKLIVTKLIIIPVTVGPSDGNVDFTHIEEGLTFPLPSSSALDSYVVYIGFDPMGAVNANTKLKTAPKAKPKPKPNPNTPTG
jgi:hypothetical protein